MTFQRPIFKPKKCAYCRLEFIPERPMQRVCCLGCAAALAKKKREKIERAADRQKREELKTRSQWISDAQDVFNAFIRERDKDLPCICCGKFPDSDDFKCGGVWDAGHYLSRGAYPELRFNEDNCHKQLKTCNGGSAKYAKKGRTVSQGYRERLIEKIGIDRVEKLEGPNDAKHYTIEELKALIAEYRKKTKELRKG